MSRLKFVDLFAGLGGFHRAMAELGHVCVFASEVDTGLREAYVRNFPNMKRRLYGDIRDSRDLVPEHDVLCAGFPCQPFSKSGKQQGLRDLTRGTLFFEIQEIVRVRRPQFLILENVGNFEVHDSGRTWRTVYNSLNSLGYQVRGTTHVKSGGHGLISPHHLGFPHRRDRFFIVASRDQLPSDPFPSVNRSQPTSLASIVQPRSTLSEEDIRESALSMRQIKCIQLWNRLIQAIPKEISILSPLWGDETVCRYPYRRTTPYYSMLTSGGKRPPRRGRPSQHFEAKLSRLPPYARSKAAVFPKWKSDFIRDSRAWFERVQPWIPPYWREELRSLPHTLRRMEWNCKGEPRDLWRYVLQFRPSGLRVHRYESCPSLVSMTITQIPILGPEQRFITRTEGLRLFGFPDWHALPQSRRAAFRALGNSVHVAVVKAIGVQLVGGRNSAEPGRMATTSRPSPAVRFGSKPGPEIGVEPSVPLAQILGGTEPRGR